jgi:ankyrin repeat protein
VHSENAAVVKYLLDHGADPDKADDVGLTPLHSAAGIGPLSIPMHLCFAHVHQIFLSFRL